MLAELSATTVLLIAAPVAVVLAVLVLVLYASQRTRPSTATRLEREASRRDRARSRQVADPEEEVAAEPVLVTAGDSHASAEVAEVEPGTGLAVPDSGALEAGPEPRIKAALEEAQRARLVAPPVPTRDPEKAELDRRQFLNRGLVGGTALGFGIFGVASISFMYPKGGKGFGGKVNAGKAVDAIDYYKNNKKPFYVPEGRFYLMPFQVAPPNDAKAKAVYPATYDASKQAGVVAIYQKCAHLGCRVPWCEQSEWFECPCHGSKYNAMGEKQGGPAPRGLSRFKFTVDSGGNVVADTGTPLDAPPIGINTPGLPDPSTHCV